jgi:hypothetical protein
MEHWRSVLPEGSMLEIDYEQTVADQGSVSRQVIEFVGLDWDDRCLRFWETGREVLTLSRDQVNKPIYSSSVGRSAKWGRNLDPLREVLARGWRGKDVQAAAARGLHARALAGGTGASGGGGGGAGQTGASGASGGGGARALRA